nr:WYL domain-containing protein [Verticiella sp. GG226]
MSDVQRVDNEPGGSPFDVHVRSTVPSTGQLLRWLLGCGDNIELLKPANLRNTVVQQSMKMAAIYGMETIAAD